MPFFVVSCAEALHAVAPSATGGDAVPWDMAQSVQQRVAALPGSARAVLGVAAILGRVVPPDILVAAAARPEEEVLEALELACRAQLLIEEADRYSFAHDVIREIVGADLGPARRLLLHRRVAEALEQRPGESPVDLLAYHYGRSGKQVKVAQYLEGAGDKARAQAAHVAGVGYFREAVQCLEGLGRTLDAARVQEKLGAVLDTAGQYTEALAVLERAAATLEAAGDLEAREPSGRLLQVYAQLHCLRHEPAAARELLGEALAIFRRVGARKDVERAERDLAGVQHGALESGV